MFRKYCNIISTGKYHNIISGRGTSRYITIFATVGCSTHSELIIDRSGQTIVIGVERKNNYSTTVESQQHLPASTCIANLSYVSFFAFSFSCVPYMFH
jgi:hypothetical protein